MTLLPDGGPALPVAVTTTRKVQGGSAIPVYGYTTAPTDGRPSLGGVAVPVRVLTAADLKQNGGQWTVEGRPYAMPVYTAPATARVMGGPALAVYPINAWPTTTPAFAPTDIANLALWLKADAGLFKDAAKAQPCTADADAVYTWADQSGRGRDAVQAVAGARPVMKTAIKNGLAVVRLDGSDDTLATAAFATFPSKRGTLFLVHQKTAAAYGATMQSLVQWVLYGPGTGFGNYAWADVGNKILQAIATDNVWRVLTLTRDADTNINFRKDATEIGNTTIEDNAYAAAVCNIGAQNGSEFWGGDFAEIILYDAALTAGQRTQVETYLNTRWAVY